MSLHALIFDVYKTLMSVGPAAPDAQEEWPRLWQDILGKEPSCSLSTFSAKCREVVAVHHAAATEAGVYKPEVYWPHIVTEALPELAELTPEQLKDFQARHITTLRTLDLLPPADLLNRIVESGVPLGIASNAQPYTLDEMDEILGKANLTRDIFDPSLIFFSFDSGFSKPNPHVFRILTARLAAKGIRPEETLMVGDREDNDVLPARAQGWRAWHISDTKGSYSGSWLDLADYLHSAGVI